LAVAAVAADQTQAMLLLEMVDQVAVQQQEQLLPVELEHQAKAMQVVISLLTALAAAGVRVLLVVMDTAAAALAMVVLGLHLQ